MPLRGCVGRTGFESPYPLGRKTKGPVKGPLIFLAERAGFEPAVRYKRTLAFQASALSHSATSPIFDLYVVAGHRPMAACQYTSSLPVAAAWSLPESASLEIVKRIQTLRHFNALTATTD